MSGLAFGEEARSAELAGLKLAAPPLFRTYAHCIPLIINFLSLQWRQQSLQYPNVDRGSEVAGRALFFKPVRACKRAIARAQVLA